MERVILHCDFNSFYASVECLHHPEIRKKPVAVGGDAEQRHGIILAKNQLAKRYHVQTGEALWQAKAKCPDLVIVPPHYDLYMRFSKMAHKIYLDYTDQVEPFGLDECWLDVTGSGIRGTGMEIAEEIRRRIRKELGITVSIGVSYNKIFAKLGSDYRKPDAITRIGKENYREIAWPLPVEDLLYVGPATERKLKRIGIDTIGALAQTSESELVYWLGKWGIVLRTFANGMDFSPVEKYGAVSPVKSIGNSSTTPRDLTCDDDVRIMVFVLADSVGRRLREQGLCGRVVSISVRDANLISITRQHKLPRYTTLTADIVDAAMQLFKAAWQWPHPIRSIGVSISDLAPDTMPTQISLFSDERARVRKERLDKTTDWLKRRFGSKSVVSGTLLLDRTLSNLDPKKDHVIHPVGYFK